MESGCPCFPTASPHARPTNFINPKHLQLLVPSSSTNIRTIKDNVYLNSSTCRRRISRLCVKATRAVFSGAGGGGQTLSSNWDVSNYSAAPSWLPRFEELDTTNMLLRQRIVFLGSQVDDTTADFIISQLLLLDAEDQKKDIRLFINSPGGSVTSAMGIYDAMKLCKADVSTICLGLAASMGAFLLASGTKGKRFCMPNARVMIHEPSGVAGGVATEMNIRVREMCYQKIKMNKILSRITGKPEEQIDVDTERDYFMNPWQAKDYGLIDAVIDDGKPGLVAPIVDATPPPKTRVWYLWKAVGSRKAKQNLPSEEKLLQNGYVDGQSNDDGRGTEQKEEAPTSS